MRTIYYKSYKNMVGKIMQLNAYNVLQKNPYHKAKGWVKVNFPETRESIIDDIARDLGITLKGYNVEFCGLLERVMYSEKRKKWQYVAGQSYTSEMRTLKSLFR